MVLVYGGKGVPASEGNHQIEMTFVIARHRLTLWQRTHRMRTHFCPSLRSSGSNYMAHTNPIVLSHVQAAPLLEARRKGQARTEVSPDLGLTTVPVAITAEGVIFPQGEHVPWQAIEKKI